MRRTVKITHIAPSRDEHIDLYNIVAVLESLVLVG